MQYNPTTQALSQPFRFSYLNYEFNEFRIFNNTLFITLVTYDRSYEAYVFRNHYHCIATNNIFLKYRYEKYIHRTDGTPEGTILVGKLGSNTVRYYDIVAEGCGNMFFTIEDTTTKYKSLWVVCKTIYIIFVD